MIPFRLSLALLAVIASPVLRCADERAPSFESLAKIDAHSHVFEDYAPFHELFRRLNLRTINLCNNGTNGRLEEMHAIALDLYRKQPALYPWVSTFDLRGRDQPAYTAEVIAGLERTFQQGALGVKIWKEIGLEIKTADGKFVLPDDPRFDPIYTYIAGRGKVLHAHIAEPIDAWLPLDKESAHYAYYSTHPEWHLYGKPGYPPHAALIAARDHILEKHPDLVVVGSHLGSMERDLEGLAVRFERYPNFHIDCSARTRNLTRLPSDQVRAFMIRYQDRILYGADMEWKPFLRGPVTDADRKSHLARMERQYRSDYEYYAGSGEITYFGRTVRALNLPRSVLEKFYHANAERIHHLPVTPP